MQFYKSDNYSDKGDTRSFIAVDPISKTDAQDKLD